MKKYLNDNLEFLITLSLILFLSVLMLRDWSESRPAHADGQGEITASRLFMADNAVIRIYCESGEQMEWGQDGGGIIAMCPIPVLTDEAQYLPRVDRGD